MSDGHLHRLLRSVASAPGKLILFGEHAVVHDRPAVAVATSLRTTATVEELHDSVINLSFPDLHPDSLILPLAALQPCLSRTPPSFAPCPTELLQLLQSLVADHATQEQSTNAAFIAAVVPALFLLVCIVVAPVSSKSFVARGLSLHVHSDLPVGAGLGSSAAFSVSVAAAALELSALSTAASCHLPPTPCRIDRSVVNDWALQAERLLHGNPSGIDNATSTFGGALRFQKSRGFTSTIIPSLPLLLVNTMQPRDTRSLVAAVGRRLQQHPSVFAPLLDALGAASDDALMLLQTSPLPDDWFERVKTLCAAAHGTLTAIGVGHRLLDGFVGSATSLGCAAKLTGAGGGGCAFAVLDEREDAERQKMELEKLLAKDFPQFRCFQLRAGGEGVRWHSQQ